MHTAPENSPSPCSTLNHDNGQVDETFSNSPPRGKCWIHSWTRNLGFHVAQPEPTFPLSQTMYETKPYVELPGGRNVARWMVPEPGASTDVWFTEFFRQRVCSHCKAASNRDRCCPYRALVRLRMASNNQNVKPISNQDQTTRLILIWFLIDFSF